MRAVDSPIPPVEPVTTQTRPASPRSTAGSVDGVTTILLARHGETDWNRDRRVQGHSDQPLNETGRTQSHALADDLEGLPVEAVYSSDLARAFETARIVADRLGLPVTALRDLREKNFGSWEGLTDEEVFRRFPEARGGSWGDGETPEELSERVLRALRRIAVEHPDGEVLVVAHGGPLRALLRQCAVERDGPIANCHVFRIVAEDGSFRSVD
jgi:broad specificity phosphatase PhoE